MDAKQIIAIDRAMTRLLELSSEELAILMGSQKHNGVFNTLEKVDYDFELLEEKLYDLF